MKRSVTIKLESDILLWARHQAVNADLSLTAWVAGIIENMFGQQITRERPLADEAIRVMENARSAGGRKVSREELYSERLKDN